MLSLVEERKRIEHIQAAIIRQKAKWIAGKTSVSRLSRDELKQLCGTLIRPIPEELRIKPSILAILPVKLDWRNKDGINWTTTIKHQGQCGSCWAFGTLAAIEAQYNIQMGIPNINRDLSEQYLVSCFAKSCAGQTLNAVSNWLKTLWKPITAETGTPDEACLPYQGKVIPCENACHDHLNRLYHLKDWHDVADDMEAIKNYILIAPCPAVMMVYEDFGDYTGGIYEHVWGEEAGWHSITIVGWDDDNSCWICKNSWGEGFGESGWFRIKYDECFIEKFVMQYDQVGRGFGNISCTTNPSGAEIILDDVPTGNYTPYTIENIASFSFNIGFKLTGYNDCYKDISLSDGETANVHCDLILPPKDRKSVV